MAVLGLRFCARAFSSCGKRGPLFIAVRGPLTIAASLVAEHRLQTRRLSNCGSRAQLPHGMWDPPRPGLEPVSPALAGRFSTTAPPGKPHSSYFEWVSLVYFEFLSSIIKKINIIEASRTMYNCSHIRSYCLNCLTKTNHQKVACVIFFFFLKFLIYLFKKIYFLSFLLKTGWKSIFSYFPFFLSFLRFPTFPPYNSSWINYHGDSIKDIVKYAVINSNEEIKLPLPHKISRVAGKEVRKSWQSFKDLGMWALVSLAGRVKSL